MSMSDDELRELYHHPAYPRASGYDPRWAIANEMGPNALWLTEALSEVMELRPGMRVLDMGCGRALSSVFLAREYGLQVWATDLWIKPTENWQRICEAGVSDSVFPVYAEARSLPFADEFFDAIVSLDSYHYYGTDVHYLEFHMLKLLKPGGQIGVVCPASPREVPEPLSEHLDEQWYWLHSVDWWRRLWDRTPGLEVERAEELPGGWELWVRWHEILDASGGRNRPDEAGELATLREDGGRYLSFNRLVGRRT